MRKLFTMSVLLVGCAILMAQKPDDEVKIAFEDVTKASGLEMAKGQGRRMAWGDYNNDGYEDLLLTGTHLFKNNKNGKFTNVTKDAKLDGAGQGGGIWGDYDNDGYLDILAYSFNSYTLWHNNKHGAFSNVTKAAGLTNNPYPTQAVAWIDVNNDSYLDFYVTNYEKQGLKDAEGKEILAQGTPDVLYINNKDGTFAAITARAGVSETEKPRCGYGVSPADFNNDGLMDIYVTNYRLGPNYLYKNNGDSTFTEVARESGIQGKETPVQQENGTAYAYGHSIGACWGDIDNDGYLDLFCANLAHPQLLNLSDTSKLYINQGPPDYNFTDIREESGIPYVETQADPSFGDYDKDGFLDLYLSVCYKDRYVLFYRNLGGHRFADVTSEVKIKQDDGWGGAWCDYDNDGNLDLAVGGGWDSTFKLYRNPGNKNPYLKVKVVGSHCNKCGIGARVKITAGKLVQIRDIAGVHGTCSQDSLIAFFGLAGHKGPVDVEVRFPCGQTKTLKAQSINQMITVSELY